MKEIPSPSFCSLFLANHGRSRYYVRHGPLSGGLSRPVNDLNLRPFDVRIATPASPLDVANFFAVVTSGGERKIVPTKATAVDKNANLTKYRSLFDEYLYCLS